MFLICFLPEYRFASLGLLQSPTTLGIVSLSASVSCVSAPLNELHLCGLMFQSSQLMDLGPSSLPIVF